MTRQEYCIVISNSQHEVAARLGVIYSHHEGHDIKDVIEELNKIISLIQQIKRAYIFLKQ